MSMIGYPTNDPTSDCSEVYPNGKPVDDGMSLDEVNSMTGINVKPEQNSLAAFGPNTGEENQESEDNGQNSSY